MNPAQGQSREYMHGLRMEPVVAVRHMAARRIVSRAGVAHGETAEVTQHCTIVADPPWKVATGRPMSNYSNMKGADGELQKWVVAGSTSRPQAYPTMTVAEICALRPSTAPAAHLYLWTINAYLQDAFTVARAWGFKPSTMLVWAKRPMGGGLGGCYGLATEYCLFARRGTLKATGRVGRNWFDWKRPYKNGAGLHSAKPPEFYSMVETISPGPRLEMFARAPRPGWDVWGNEVESYPLTQEGQPK
jgi:N6-adenosine-specific RNA methylase IME4